MLPQAKIVVYRHRYLKLAELAEILRYLPELGTSAAAKILGPRLRYLKMAELDEVPKYLN